MPRVDAIYKWLAQDLRPETVAVFADSLPTADEAYAERIAAILIERRHESAWGALAANYERLSPDMRARVLRHPEQLSAGLAIALQSTSPAARQSALRLLADAPCPQLAYRAAECLLDSNARVQDAAALAVYAIAERGLEQRDTVRQITQALRECIRTFERHRRPELLQAALWYADDLEPDLWKLIVAAGAQCGQTIERNLAAWSDPRLAAFLLLALAQPSWTKTAAAVLDTWNSVECGVALLSRTDLLAREDVRHALPKLKNPGWFVTTIGALSTLPERIVVTLPQWLLCLGFREPEKWRCLDMWLSARRSELQLGAAQALAGLPDARANQSLARIERGDHPAAIFARWYLAGTRILAEHGPAERRPDRVHATRSPV